MNDFLLDTRIVEDVVIGVSYGNIYLFLTYAICPSKCRALTTAQTEVKTTGKPHPIA